MFIRVIINVLFQKLFIKKKHDNLTINILECRILFPCEVSSQFYFLCAASSAHCVTITSDAIGLLYVCVAFECHTLARHPYPGACASQHVSFGLTLVITSLIKPETDVRFGRANVCTLQCTTSLNEERVFPVISLSGERVSPVISLTGERVSPWGFYNVGSLVNV